MTFDLLTNEQSQWLCAGLTLVIALLLRLHPASQRLRTTVLWLVILAGALNAFATIGRRNTHSNFADYYLGVRYPCPYAEFYRVILSAREEPHIYYRDLAHPDRILRIDRREQRLYFMDLLDRFHRPYEPSMSTSFLEQQCRNEGLFKAEGDAILHQLFKEQTIPLLKRDAAYPHVSFDDYGFNGSPFYAAVRQIDPSIHLPYGPFAGTFNTVWQILALFLIASFAGRALDWTPEERLLSVALILSSWDFIGWALNGLVAAGWILPTAFALWGMRKRSAWMTGAGVAWATLIKLFPVMLLVPLCVGTLKKLKRRSPLSFNDYAIRTYVAFGVSVVALAGVSLLSGFTWTDFFHKIHEQFGKSHFVMNAAGVSQLLVVAGVWDTRLILVPQALMFAALAGISWARADDDRPAALPWTALLVIACMGFLTRMWPSYYAIVALLLVPNVARENLPVAVLMLALGALSYAMPDFDETYTGRQFALLIVKTAPYLALPLVAFSLAWPSVPQPGRLFASARWILAVTFLLAVALLVARVYRRAAAASYAEAAIVLEDQHLNDGAIALYQKSAALDPGHADTFLRLGAALESKGNVQGAAAAYEQALRADPESDEAQVDLGTLLAQHGKLDRAIAHLREACRLAPYDEVAHFNLGSAFLAMGKREEAATEFATALKIKPDFKEAKQQRDRLSAPGT